MVRVSTLVKAFAAVATVGRAVDPNELDQAFAKYVKDFHKEYRHEKEREARRLAFHKNYMHIQSENAKGHSYKLGLNEFADMTAEEFAMTHLGIRQPAGSLWGDLPYLGTHERRNATLAASVDWNAQGAVTPVKNQQNCGSCWAFSTTGALEGAWKIASGNLVSFSEQELVDCAGSFGENGCGGGFMDGGFQYAQANGMCTEDSYAYEARNAICRSSSCTKGMPQGAVVGYKDVTADDTQALMDAVAQQPVSVAIEADQTAFQLYQSGVLSSGCGTALDHGVLVVGYGNENGQDFWLVKNSWGSGWGMQGFIKILRGVAGAGICGIKQNPSYPVVKAAQEPLAV